MLAKKACFGWVETSMATTNLLLLLEGSGSGCRSRRDQVSAPQYGTQKGPQSNYMSQTCEPDNLSEVGLATCSTGSIEMPRRAAVGAPSSLGHRTRTCSSTHHVFRFSLFSKGNRLGKRQPFWQNETSAAKQMRNHLVA